MRDDLLIPDGWMEMTLGAIGHYLNGRAFKKSEWSTSGRPIIRIQDLTGSHRNPNYFEGEVEDRYVVRPGDLLISWSATLGAYIWDGPEAVLNQHIFKVESNIDKRFHYHLVRERIAALQSNAHGSGMEHITKGVFDSTPVAVPNDRKHQQQIATMIDEVDARRISGLERLAAARRAVERFRYAVAAAACAGRLTADWRDEHPTAQSVEHALAEVVGSHKSKSRPDQPPIDLPLPDTPDRYVISTIGDAAELLEYGTSVRCDASAADGVPVLRMGNIQDGAIERTNLKYCEPSQQIEKLMLRDGDLLFNRTNSPELVGKSAVFHETDPMSFASYLIRVRFHSTVAHPDFASYWLNSASGKEWACLVKTDGVSQSNINGTKLALMPIPLPPIDEQHAIVERASHMLATADTILSRIDAAAAHIERSSHAVLTKVFRGELATTMNGGPQ